MSPIYDQQTWSRGTKMSQRLKPGVREAPGLTGPVSRTEYRTEQTLSPQTSGKWGGGGCVFGNFIRSSTTWNYWHMVWGFEILWHKVFKCNGICSPRIWLFSGENIARQKQFKECHPSFPKSWDLKKWVTNLIPKVKLIFKYLPLHNHRPHQA